MGFQGRVAWKKERWDLVCSVTGEEMCLCVCVDKGEKGAYIRDGLRVRQRLSGSSAGG